MFKLKNQLLFITTIFLFMLVMVGCGASEETVSDSAPEENASEEQPKETNTQEETSTGNENVRTVEHAMGSVEIEGTPERVITLFQAATDTALALGVKPVGAVESWVEKPFYYYIRDKMDGVTNLGLETQPNLEEIIALEPDLIIASKSRHESIYDQLSAIAPTIMDENHYNWKGTVSLSALALNKQEEEEQLLANWDNKVDEFKELMGDRLNTEVSVVGFRSDHARIFFNTFSSTILEDVGLSRPANQQEDSWGVKLTSKENIPEMDADVIFDMTSMSRDDGRVDTRSDWTEHQLWQNLKAVQNEKVYKVDPVIWNNGSGPIAAKLMVEDLFTHFELK